MKINHFDGITLEHICSDVFSCDRGGMGGVINSDVFEYKPFLAAYLIIAKLYKGLGVQDEYIESFLNKWQTIFEDTYEEGKYIFDEYGNELRELIKVLSLF